MDGVNPCNELSSKRKKAIELAASFGWEVTRKSKKTWEFRQPDTGGLWDVFRIPHANLSEHTVLTKLEAYEPELGRAVFDAVCEARAREHKKWLKSRRPLWGLQ